MPVNLQGGFGGGLCVRRQFQGLLWAGLEVTELHPGWRHLGVAGWEWGEWSWGHALRSWSLLRAANGGDQPQPHTPIQTPPTPGLYVCLSVCLPGLLCPRPLHPPSHIWTAAAFFFFPPRSCNTTTHGMFLHCLCRILLQGGGGGVVLARGALEQHLIPLP